MVHELRESNDACGKFQPLCAGDVIANIPAASVLSCATCSNTGLCDAVAAALPGPESWPAQLATAVLVERELSSASKFAKYLESLPEQEPAAWTWVSMSNNT